MPVSSSSSTQNAKQYQEIKYLIDVSVLLGEQVILTLRSITIHFQTEYAAH